MAANFKTGINIGKEKEKVSIFFTDDMTVNLENPKESSKKSPRIKKRIW